MFLTLKKIIKLHSMKVKTSISKYKEIQRHNCLCESMPAGRVLVRSLTTQDIKLGKYLRFGSGLNLIKYRNVTYLGVMPKKVRDCYRMGAQEMIEQKLRAGHQSAWHKALRQLQRTLPLADVARNYKNPLRDYPCWPSARTPWLLS